MPLTPVNSPNPLSGIFTFPTSGEIRANQLQTATANNPTALGLPSYVSPIRPTVPVVQNSPFQYSTPSRNNFFDTFTSGLTSVANAVRTGASAIGDATRSYDQLRTTLQPVVQSVQPLPANSNTRGLVASDPINSGNTLTIPYLLPQGVGNNANTYILAIGAVLLIVLLMRK